MSITPKVTLSPGQNVAVHFTNYCNKKCPGCLGRKFNYGRSRKNIRSSDVRSLRRILGTYTRVTITGGGEPTLHPLFFESFRALCRKNGQLDAPKSITLKTNGRVFSTPSKARAFLRRLKKEACGVDVDVVMSIDDHHARDEPWESLVQKARNLRDAAEREKVNYGYAGSFSKDDAKHGYSEKAIIGLCGLPEESRGTYTGFRHYDWLNGEVFLQGERNGLSIWVDADGAVYPSDGAYYRGKPGGSLRNTPMEEILARNHPGLLFAEGSKSWMRPAGHHLEIDLGSLERATAPRKAVGASQKSMFARAKECATGFFSRRR
jgi:hypothetical protein